MKKCKHEPTPYWWSADTKWTAMPLTDEPTAMCCWQCGTWLPLGPANEKDEAVRVEMRAAELADADYDVCDFSDMEWLGYGEDEFAVFSHMVADGPQRLDLTDRGWQAGYLARVIVEHEEG